MCAGAVAANPRPYLVSVQNLADAAMRDAQLTRDDTGPDSSGGHLYNFQADVVGQGAAVYEDAAKLVHPTLSWNEKKHESQAFK